MEKYLGSYPLGTWHLYNVDTYFFIYLNNV